MSLSDTPTASDERSSPGKATTSDLVPLLLPTYLTRHGTLHRSLAGSEPKLTSSPTSSAHLPLERPRPAPAHPALSLSPDLTAPTLSGESSLAQKHVTLVTWLPEWPSGVSSADRRRRAPAAARPSSARAAGAGGSTNTMLKLYTDSGEAGLKV